MYRPIFKNIHRAAQNQATDEARPIHQEALGFLQDYRKYRNNTCIVDEEEWKHTDKIIKELVIESQPHCSSKMCREIFKLANVGDPFLGVLCKGIRKGIGRKTIMIMSDIPLSTDVLSLTESRS